MTALPVSAVDRGLEAAADPWRRVIAASAGLLLIFFVTEHETSFAGSQVTDFKESAIEDQYVEQIEQGDAVRRLALLGYAAWGALALATRSTPAFNVRGVGVACLAMLFGWATLSAGWSDEPSLTIKRLGVAGCILLGSAGLARWLRPREFAMVALLTLTAFVGMSLLLDLRAGGRPWAGDYRFGGTLHPNIQAAYCGVLCLAAAVAWLDGRARWLTSAVFVFAFVMLLQTQSRTSVLAVVFGLIALNLLRRTSRERLLASLALLAVLGAGILAYGTVDAATRTSLFSTAMLGRTEQAGSLTGRVPLWQELSSYAAERPLIGFGYENFWSPDRIAAVAKSQDWAIQSAHNAYFEVALQLGVVGLAIAMAFVLASFGAVRDAFEQTRDIGYAFTYSLLAFAVVNGLLEAHFAKLKFPTVLALIGVFAAILYSPVGREAAPPTASAAKS